MSISALAQECNVVDSTVFRFCRTQTIVMRSKEGTGMKRYPNEFEEAMEVLRRTVAPAEIDEWRRTAFR